MWFFVSYFSLSSLITLKSKAQYVSLLCLCFWALSSLLCVLARNWSFSVVKFATVEIHCLHRKYLTSAVISAMDGRPETLRVCFLCVFSHRRLSQFCFYVFYCSSPEISSSWTVLQRSFAESWRKNWRWTVRSREATHGTTERYPDR